MTRSPSSSLLSELQNPTFPAALNAALVALKNELIGHEQRKRVWIGYGIVPIVAHILDQRRGDTGKGISHGAGLESSTPTEVTQTLAEDDMACIHAAVIVGNIAQAGSSFVAPLLAGGIIPRMVSILSTSNCPIQLMVAILKSFNTIADRLPPQYANDWPVDRQLAATLYSKEHIRGLAVIMGQSSPLPVIQQTISLTARLISKTCVEEGHKSACVEAGILDSLAVRLASFVVSQGFVLPGAESYVHEPGSLGNLPPSAPPKAQLGPVLQCISVLIQQSSVRTEHFLASPAIVTVFPKPRPEFAPMDIKRGSLPDTPWLSGSAVPHYTVSNPIDALLPAVPSSESRHSSSDFPPLGFRKFYSRNSSFLSLGLDDGSAASESNDEEENAVVSWLIWLIRSDSSLVVRLRAANILISFFRLGLVKKSRTPMLGMLLVPMLVGLLEREPDLTGEMNDGDVLPLQLRIKEELPHLLANLVMDSTELQKAAVDAHAIKYLANLLKKTFDPLPDHAKGMWSPVKAPKTPRNRPEPEMSLGISGPTPMARHLMVFREGILLALASIAPFKDDYRKAICDHGVIPFIVDSLKPYTTIPHLSDNGPNGPHMIPGNPTPTLLAACNAARALTRSVSVLRTSLNDANVGPPIFTLLKNKDVDVQVAATTVVCNLALDFSPMKEAVITNGALKVLCEHAHASHARLRLESIWALKHLVYNSANEIKVKVLQELGVGWTMSILLQDPSVDEHKLEEESLGWSAPSGLSNTNCLGQPIDLLNPKNTSSDDVSMTEVPINQGLENFKAHAAERRARAESDAFLSPETQKLNLAIQEQLLELLRNVICGPGASEMIEYLLREIGQTEFFRMILDKIRPTLPSSARSKAKPRLNTSSPQIAPTQPAEILIACTYIIVHLAASETRHRRMLVSQTELLRAIVPLFNHPNRVIRVNCCWIVINLTYEDDAGDKLSCRQRARELERLDVMQKLAVLREDQDLDVRERAKTAVNIMGGLLN